MAPQSVPRTLDGGKKLRKKLLAIKSQQKHGTITPNVLWRSSWKSLARTASSAFEHFFAFYKAFMRPVKREIFY